MTEETYCIKYMGGRTVAFRAKTREEAIDKACRYFRCAAAYLSVVS